MASRRALNALVSLLVLLVTVPLAAQDVFFVDFRPLGDGVGDTVARRINENTKSQLESVGVTYTDRVRAGDSAGGNAALTEANNEYQRGIGLYVVNDFANAALALENALALFRENASEISDLRVIPDALFKLAESYFKSGNEEMARMTLNRALAIAPGTPANEASGQSYNQFYAAVLETSGRNGAGTISVTSNPVGATVLLNGAEVGVSPVVLADIPAGDHFVQVVGSDGTRAGQVVAVARSREMTVNLDLARAAAARATEGGEPRYLRSLRDEVGRGTISDALLPYMRETASRQGVPYVLVGVVVRRDNGYEALPFVYRASDDLFANVPTQMFDAELSSVSVNGYQLAASIQGALRRFPEDDLVTGAPILVAPPAPVASASPSPVAAAPAPTVFTIDVPTPAPAPAPTPAPAPAPVVAPAPVAAPAPAPAYAPPAPAPAPVYAAPAPAPAPAPTYAAPAPTYAAPAPTYAAPAPTYAPPAPTYAAPAPTYGAPAPAYGAPAPTYGAPAPTYGQPAPAYGQPAPAYGQPAPAYGQPAPAYGQPAPAYGQPAPAYGQPAPAYGQPAPAYGQPAPAYGQPAGAAPWASGNQFVEDPGPRERRPIYRSPWLYVGGAAVLGGVIGGVVAATSGGSEPVNGYDAAIAW